MINVLDNCSLKAGGRLHPVVDGFPINILTVLVSLLLSFLSQSLNASDASANNQNHELGRAIYNFRCYYCHGYSGNAKTLASTLLSSNPVDFTRAPPEQLTRPRMLASVTHGVAGTAMKSFSNTLTHREIELVVDFVRHEFMTQREPNTRYHTAANGWPDHERYIDAYPFATGEIALDRDWSTLGARERKGKRLFLGSCISCHDRAHVSSEGPVWEADAVSFPRFGFASGDSLKPPDAFSGASPFAGHDVVPVVANLTARESAGERLFQANCAFCHGADGSGRNWIGTFLQPRARDLTDSEFMRTMTAGRLRDVISNGLTGTSMPAWRGVLNTEQIESVIAYIDRVIHPLASE